MRTIRGIIAFIALIRAMWRYSLALATMTNATQKALTAEQGIALNANTIASMRGLGLPSPGTTGGWPSTYDPSYGSQLSACLQSLINNLHSGGIL